MVLVSDVALADMIALIAYEPDAADPRKVNVLVLSIEENANKRRSPSAPGFVDPFPLPAPPIYSPSQ